MYFLRSMILMLLESADNAHAKGDEKKEKICRLRAIGFSHLFNEWWDYMMAINETSEDEDIEGTYKIEKSMHNFDYYHQINAIGKKILEGKTDNNIDMFISELQTEIGLCLNRTKHYRQEYVDKFGNSVDRTYMPGTIGTGIEEF